MKKLTYCELSSQRTIKVLKKDKFILQIMTVNKEAQLSYELKRKLLDDEFWILIVKMIIFKAIVEN